MKRAWTIIKIINTGIAATWLSAFGGRRQYGGLRSGQFDKLSFISLSTNVANITMGHNTITTRGVCDHWRGK